MAETPTTAFLEFHNNRLLPLLFGEQDRHLAKIEKQLTVSISSRGNRVSIAGTAEKVRLSQDILNELYGKIEKGLFNDEADVEAAIRFHLGSDGGNGVMAEAKNKANGKGVKGATRNQADKTLFGNPAWREMVITTQKKQIMPHSETQAAYLEAMLEHDMVFASGPAGTGKTYFAVAVAAHLFLNHEVERIILSRPAVEAGEKLGFLPGDMREKVDPYLRPLYDALHDMMPAEKVQKHITNGEIEIAPLAFMRGRTLKHAFIILDEAQNLTPTQMKMFLTRMGEGSRMVINGDMSQTDLPVNQLSGLEDAMRRLETIKDIAIIHFQKSDIVRHDLTAKIIEAYEK